MNKPNESLEGPSQRRSWWSRNWFYTALITIAVIGAFCAFCVPLFIPEPFSAGDSVAALRQAILAATGGILAMLTLWENRRKNLQEKDKNDLDHARQVKAERRSRYAKAIEQLADDKSTVRLGGVYSLVKLADEWLTDSRTLPSENDRKEEAQIIINSLCLYIRPPFPLAENKDSLTSNRNKESYNGDYNSDRAKLYGEQETRSTIIQEVTNRLRNENKTIKNSNNSPRNGPWSDFSYNLSGAIFFYDIDFSSCTINGQVNFSNSTFEESAEFCNSVFNSDINFTETLFKNSTGFIGTTFEGRAEFSGAEFERPTHFIDSTFKEFANFKGAKLNCHANFRKATFENIANFSNAVFSGHPENSTIFDKTVFMQEVYYRSAYFKGPTRFIDTYFAKEPQFIDSSDPWAAATFSDRVEHSEYKFKVRSDSPGKIITEEKEIGKKTFTIPKGCRMYTPTTIIYL